MNNNLLPPFLMNYKQEIENAKKENRPVNLREANLQQANLRQADLRQANLWGAKIEKKQKDILLNCLGIVID